jgi:hypothetical protein
LEKRLSSDISTTCSHQFLNLLLPLQAAAFARAQIRTIGNAIKKLSSELYTKDVHFIMELVQVSKDLNPKVP